jgi:hypothetical protein
MCPMPPTLHAEVPASCDMHDTPRPLMRGALGLRLTFHPPVPRSFSHVARKVDSAERKLLAKSFPALEAQFRLKAWRIWTK